MVKLVYWSHTTWVDFTTEIGNRKLCKALLKFSTNSQQYLKINLI